MIRKCLAFVALCATLSARVIANGITPPSFENQVIRPVDGNTPDQFGKSIAIDGSSALIGAYGDNGRGSVYSYAKDAAGAWRQDGKFTVPGLSSNAGFGRDVGLSGDWAIAGAFQEASVSGRAYLFKRTSGVWNQVATLAPTVSGTPRFGYAVDIESNLSVVGAPYYTPAIPSCAVHVYSPNASQQWTLSATLTPNDGAASDGFGSEIDLRGNRLIVGSPQDDNVGSAYIFDRSASGAWSQVAKLTPDDGRIYDGFARSVALGDGVAIVGNRSAVGGAYLFKETTPGNWEQFAKLTYDGFQTGGSFGVSVSIWNNYALVGAPSINDGVGAAYLFKFDLDGSWSQVAKYVASDGQSLDYFCRATALGRGALLVGAEGNSAQGYAAGAVYSYAFVPEPSSLVLAATTGLALSLSRRRQIRERP